MLRFAIECHQNEHLAPGVGQVDAVVTVSAPSLAAEAARTGSSVPRAEVIIVDVSGSMKGRRIREATRAAAAAVDCLEDGARFALVGGNHEAWRLYPDTAQRALAVASPGTRADARSALDGMKARGGTAMGSWLDVTNRLFEDESGINHAILLTDGLDESESPADRTAAIERARGRFQCDCRGVGTDWSVAELREVSTALLGSVDLVARPEDLAADFTEVMNRSMGRAVASVTLRLWTPVGASVEFVRQVIPEVLDLTDHRVEVDGQVADYPTGAWAEEARAYHIRLRVDPGSVADEMLAGRVTLIVEDEPGAQALIRAVWTADTVLTTRIDPEVAHYTGQAELAELIQEGLRAIDVGDLRRATMTLGRAVQVASESGNDAVSATLARVVDVEDAATGRIRLKKRLEPAELMGLDVASTKTVRVQS